MCRFTLLPGAFAQPLLQPESLSRNPLAVPGSLGVVCCVAELTLEEDQWRFHGFAGLAGTEVHGRLPSSATVGELGERFRKGGPLIHLVLPGAMQPVLVTDVEVSLRDIMLGGEVPARAHP
eukprot:SRR837773.24229.p2 GENE.SRR837773.24229~~SRR837773.24229.p2  ORF type:complete len:135 (-),score=35.55 SRR837773.24229:159-521(-)